MNRGRLFFDSLRFKRQKAEENKQKAMKVLLSCVLFAGCVATILVFLFSSGRVPVANMGNILVSDTKIDAKNIVAVSKIIQTKSEFVSLTFAVSRDIDGVGKNITLEREKLARLEIEKRAEEERIRKTEEEKKLLAKAKKIKPVKIAKASPKEIPAVEDGGDVQPVSMDLNNEYLPANSEELDPSGNYGIPEYWPLQGVTVSSQYGYLRERGRFHAGVDLVVDKGIPICSAGAGKIIRAEWFAGYGNCVDIQHSSGYITRYGHLSAFYVKKGDFVNAGDWVGACGSTGRSSCPHLHFEVHKNGKSMNPEHSSLKWTGKP